MEQALIFTLGSVLAYTYLDAKTGNEPAGTHLTGIPEISLNAAAPYTPLDYVSPQTTTFTDNFEVSPELRQQHAERVVTLRAETVHPIMDPVMAGEYNDLPPQPTPDMSHAMQWRS